MSNIITKRNQFSRMRSVVKSLTWRVLATIITIVIVYVFTGKLKIAFTVGGIEIVAKLLIYYFHERVWGIIKWGLKK